MCVGSTEDLRSGVVKVGGVDLYNKIVCFSVSSTLLCVGEDVDEDLKVMVVYVVASVSSFFNRYLEI